VDKRNIQDKYKGWHDDLIREDLEWGAFPFAVLMEHLQGDFNIGTIVRTANAMGAEAMFYTGKKKWDKRGAVGTYNYTMVEYLPEIRDVLQMAKESEYTMVGLEACPGARSMYDFQWPHKSLIVVGEEGDGLSQAMLNACEYKLEIPQYGSVRSLNAATAAGIAMYDYVRKYQKKSTEAVMGSIEEDTGVSLKDALGRASIDARFAQAVKRLTTKRREALIPLLEMFGDDARNEKILEGIQETVNDRPKQKTKA
jgi:tRNA(Leu) C34 or U34 (ribose-2'-O)-methylase TrmL